MMMKSVFWNPEETTDLRLLVFPMFSDIKDMVTSPFCKARAEHRVRFLVVVSQYRGLQLAGLQSPGDRPNTLLSWVPPRENCLNLSKKGDGVIPIA